VVPPSWRIPERPLSHRVDTLILKAMAKNPEDRFQSALEMKQAIMSVLRHLRIARRRPGRLSFFSNSRSRFRRMTDTLTSQALLQKSSPDAKDSSSRRREPPSPEELIRSRIFSLRSGRMFIGGTLALIALGVIGFLFSKPKPNSTFLASEIEPNNSPDQASLLMLDRPFSGSLEPTSSNEPLDLDWYKIFLSGQGPQTVKIQISGVPGQDIVLELYDSLGGLLHKTDANTHGGEEVMYNRTLSPGNYFIAIHSLPPDGEGTVVKGINQYQLRVSSHTYQSGWEMEPNDREGQASPIKPGQLMRGYLGSPTDRDVFRIESPTLQCHGKIENLSSNDLELTLLSGIPAIQTAIKTKPISESGLQFTFDLCFEKLKSPYYLILSRRSSQKHTNSSVPSTFGAAYTLKLFPNCTIEPAIPQR